ncbi:MAG: hypothetical protein R2698_04040 [Microthrixaceae bacterium]
MRILISTLPKPGSPGSWRPLPLRSLHTRLPTFTSVGTAVEAAGTSPTSQEICGVVVGQIFDDTPLASTFDSPPGLVNENPAGAVAFNT